MDNNAADSSRRPGLRARSSSLFARAAAAPTSTSPAQQFSKVDSPFACPSNNSSEFPWDKSTPGLRGHKHSASTSFPLGSPGPASPHATAGHSSRWFAGSGAFRQLVRRASQPLRSAMHGGSNGAGASRSSSLYRDEKDESEDVAGKEKKGSSLKALGKDVMCCGIGLFSRSIEKKPKVEMWPTDDGESGFFQDDEGFQLVDPAKKDITYPDFASFLPAEISSHIFSYIDERTLLTSCPLVSKQWKELSSSSYVWRRAFINKLGFWNGPRHAEWKKMYAALAQVDMNWNSRKTEDYNYLKGHKDSVYCVQFDDNKIISGSRDRCIRIWDMKTLKCTKRLGYLSNELHPPDVSPVGFHTASILCLQYDDTILVTGSSDRTCIVWSLETYLPIMRLRGHMEGVLDIAFNKEFIVSCSKDTKIIVWSRESGKMVRQIDAHSGPVNAISMSGNLVASASGDGLVKLWDISTGEMIREFAGHKRGLACVQISSDCELIVSGGNDHEIRVWDVASGECLRVLKGHTKLVRTLQVDTFNRRIISGSYDKTVAVWNLDTGARLLNMKQYHSTYVLTAKADFRRIVSASQDKNILVVDFGKDVENVGLLDGVFEGGR